MPIQVRLFFVMFLIVLCAASLGAYGDDHIADKPLFVDPVHDGAADPVVIWNRESKTWMMLYTNRRANLPGTGNGVEWVHGTQIGIAESTDGGATWNYKGTADIDLGGDGQTHWAPGVVYHEGIYHMYLTHVPGVFADWGHPRHIVHLTSKDLVHWQKQSTIKLNSDKVIDAAVTQLPNGTWRMWYNDEPTGKAIFYADSEDLYHWRDRGRAVKGPPGEGPVVFRWHDRFWMVVDVWQGLAVYRSDDALNWVRQDGEYLLREPGNGPQDGAIGSHPDVVLSNNRAYLFYFTHPGRKPGEATAGIRNRRSVIQVTELKHKNGRLSCDRNAPTEINLQPPK